MTSRVKRILEDFERLDETEKKDLVTELLRRSGKIDWGPLTEGELVRNAESVFQTLDKGESGQ